MMAMSFSIAVMMPRDDLALAGMAVGKGFFEKRREIIAGWIGF